MRLPLVLAFLSLLILGLGQSVLAADQSENAASPTSTPTNPLEELYCKSGDPAKCSISCKGPSGNEVWGASSVKFCEVFFTSHWRCHSFNDAWYRRLGAHPY